MAKMYHVYSITERPKQDNYWLNLVLRAYDCDTAKAEEDKEQATVKKNARASA